MYSYSGNYNNYIPYGYGHSYNHPYYSLETKVRSNDWWKELTINEQAILSTKYFGKEKKLDNYEIIDVWHKEVRLDPNYRGYKSAIWG